MKKSIKHNKKLIISISSILIIVLISFGIIDSKLGNKILNTLNTNTIANNISNEDYNSNKQENDITNSQISTDDFTLATVKRIIDGDTIIVTIDNTDYRLRLIGVNSPEYTSKKEPYGKEATEYTTKSLTGKTVYLQKDISQTDKYDRLLRYVWLEMPSKIDINEIKNKMFNAKILLDGYAKVATYKPDVKYVNYFTDIQKEARESNNGLWKDKK